MSSLSFSEDFFFDSDCDFSDPSFAKTNVNSDFNQYYSSPKEDSTNHNQKPLKNCSDNDCGTLFSSDYNSKETAAGSHESQKSAEKGRIEAEIRKQGGELSIFSSFVPKVVRRKPFKIIRTPPRKFHLTKKFKKQINETKKKERLSRQKAIRKRHLKPNRKPRNESKKSKATTRMKGMPPALRTALHSCYYGERAVHFLEGRNVNLANFARVEKAYENPCISEIIRNNQVTERVLQKFDAFIYHMCYWDKEICEIKSYKQFLNALKTFGDQEVTDLCEKFVAGILSDDIWIEESQAEPGTKVKFKKMREKFKINFSEQFANFNKKMLLDPP